ncbi:MAG: hypothetical protein FRX48_01157 [Lasallia pustulata]|uniref:Uncharacterized protein n=1 Tax=Lasallia pustulata TaxID=136370 RepID=A0A5M8PZP1_9LECA|nr:MAG: hypothetical protein FRX48_01157 [Lasallia pustulata]
MASTAVDASLQAALDEFRDVLTPVEKDRLRTLSQVPDPTAVITFTPQVDQENASRRGRCVASRLFGVLESVQQFSLVVDTFVSAHAGVAALVWGSLKLSILTASNVSSYFDKFSECPFFQTLWDYRLRFATFMQRL